MSRRLVRDDVHFDSPCHERRQDFGAIAEQADGKRALLALRFSRELERVVEVSGSGV